ncbi:N-acetylglucosamine kinase [Microbacterium sp.]|uniref:N-acetylglucosamine kinase n=1 Tax=Microbacterium sp. TaxID=51671 RepID=UPI003C779E47
MDSVNAATPADAVIVAVDGGGTKTDAVAVGADGRLIAHARMPGTTVEPQDLSPSVGIVDAAISEVLAKAGPRELLRCSVYLSGMDMPRDVASFAEAIAETTWARASAHPVVVGNDMFALLRAGTRRPDAIAVVCGTGINCVGVRADGEVARFAALGMISGDWGGGSTLGEAALWHAARAVDGRGDPTMLSRTVPAHLGLPDVQSVIEAFHYGRLGERTLPTLAPLVLQASDAGDVVAGRVLDRQAEEIVAFAVAAITRLDLGGRPVPVVLGGGILAAGNRRLLDGVRSGLARRAPDAEMILVRSRPIVGAALLALESIGCSEDVLVRAERELSRVD